MMQRDDLARYLDQLLEVPRFRDYCPNGLQVEGRAGVLRLVTGVSASQALIEAAIGAGADALLVHHGYFWKSEDGRITGTRRRRIGLLLQHDISLFAYHLPLDAHPEHGNNAQLGALLGFTEKGRAGEQNIVAHGCTAATQPLAAFAAHIESRLGRAPTVIGDPAQRIARIAWCTGGAQGYFEDAIALGVDAFITGEISEPQVHLARESGVAFIAAGHHATERFGVQALGAHLAARFGIEHRFIDVPNPV
jgi:dinuclear metal center YbgI/SA1388 family protein